MKEIIIIAAVASAFAFFYLIHHKDYAMSSKYDNHVPIIVTGYWLDTGESFKHYCIIGDESTCPERHGGKVFWYFRDEFEVMGCHGEFHINGFSYINTEKNNG